MKLNSLGLKVSFIFAIVITAIVASSIYIVTSRTNVLVNQLTEESATLANKAFAMSLEDFHSEALKQAEMIAHSPDTINAILNNNKILLQKEINAHKLNVDFITICNEIGTVLLRNYTDRKGDNILEYKTIVSVIATGKSHNTIEKVRGIGLSATGSAPIKNSAGKMIGVIACGFDLSKPQYLDGIKKNYNCELTLFENDTRINTTLMNEDNTRNIGTKADDKIVETVMFQKNNHHSRIKLFGNSYSGYYTPLIVDNDTIGMIFAGVNIDSVLSRKQSIITQMTTTAAIIGIIGIVGALLYNFFFITMPLKKIGDFASNLHVMDIADIPPDQISIDVYSKDEVGSLAREFEQAYRDLKEASAFEREAKESHKTLSILENILNGLDVMIYATDPVTDEVLFINNSMKQHYGLSGDCVGQHCYKILQDGFTERCSFCPTFQLEKEPNKIIEWEEQSTVTKRVYRNTDRLIKWPGGKLAHLQHSVDITELTDAKKAAELSNKQKSTFLATMSHEIRTPMNAILGISEIQLQNTAHSGDVEEAFGKIFDSGSLLLSIINDILDLSKIEADRLEIIHSKYDIPSLINDTVQLNNLRFESKRIEFNVEVDENTPLVLFGDELRIKQILNNLLSNAFKYTKDGGVRLSVAAEFGEVDKTSYVGQGENMDGMLPCTMVFRVIDTGQGMTTSQISKLFDDYTRFNLEANRATVGTGLGMSITKRLVNLMHGEISVESAVTKGTTFTVRLPQMYIGSEICGKELSEKMKVLNFQNTSKLKKVQFIREYMPYGSVLVVDDVESNLHVAKGMMMPYGLRIETVTSGYGAIEKINGGNVYDIVFMDHMMPRMDGMETTKIMREMGYNQPIVALTANALTGQAEVYMANGFDRFISKPIDSRELNLLLNELIRDKQPPEVIEAARQEKLKIASVKQAPDASEMAKSFVRDAEKAVYVLENVCAKHGSADDTDMQSYVISIHGIKSALANIGEAELSRVGRKLEQAGRDRDMSVISLETPAFLEALRQVIEKNKPSNVNIPTEVSDEDKAYLHDKLHAIKAACGAFDKKAARTAMDDLKQKKWPQQTALALDDIATHLLHSAFKKANDAVEKALTS